MPYVLGVDQGATKTSAVVMDETGCVVGSGASKGALYVLSGVDAAVEAVMAASTQAMAPAGLVFRDLIAFAAGMTGADWPEEYDLLRAALARGTGHPSVRVHNDCMVALRAGTDSPEAAVVCAGTGLNIGVRSPAHTWVFGYWLDDAYQGAFALASRMARAVVAAEAGVAPRTALEGLVLRALGYSSVEQLLRNLRLPECQAALRTLVPGLMDLADAGDPAAADIVGEFGDGVARYVVAGLERCGLRDRPVEVVLSGGILKSRCVLLRRRLGEGVVAGCHDARLTEARYEPVIGAAMLALEELRGGPLEERTTRNIALSCARTGLTRERGEP